MDRCFCAVVPLTGDADGDGVLDADEFDPDLGTAAVGTNRYLWDTDGDGLSDGEEDANASGARDPGELDPRSRDSDGDGLWDSVEILFAGTDPLDAGDPGAVVDADGDGLPSAPVVLDPDDTDPDADGDGISDGYEAVRCGLAAVLDGALKPSLGDLDCQFGPSNLDALIAQSLFLGLVAHEAFPGESNGDANRDAYVSNLDALIINTWFLDLVPYMPVPLL